MKDSFRRTALRSIVIRLTKPKRKLDDTLLPVLSLPREIRDLIYHYLLYGSIFTLVKGKQIEAIMGYQSDKLNNWTLRHEKLFEYRLLPDWLRTSKQMFLEAKELFYRRARWKPCHVMRYRTFRHYPSIVRRKNELHFLTLKYICGLEFPCLERSGRGTPHGVTDVDQLRLQVISAKDMAETLKDLTITVNLSKFWHVESLFLKNLPSQLSFPRCHFEKVEFIIQQPALLRDNFNTIAGLCEAYVELQNVLQHAAKDLVSTPYTGHPWGSGWAIKEWMEQKGDSGEIQTELHLEVKTHETRRDDAVQRALPSFTGIHGDDKFPVFLDYTFELTGGAQPRTSSWFCIKRGETLIVEGENWTISKTHASYFD